MQAEKLFQNGWAEIIPMAPPTATATWDVKPGKLGKIPSAPNGDGTWHLIRGLDYKATLQDAREWDRLGANLALRTKHYPVIDIDILDGELADLIHKYVISFLGEAPCRWGKRPKLGLVYRTTNPFATKVISFRYKDQIHHVEILADKKNFNIAGVHPEGYTYEWSTPLTVPEELTEVTETDVAELVVSLEEKLAEYEGVELLSTMLERVPQGGDLSAPSEAAIVKALAHIPNTSQLFPTRNHLVGMAWKIAGAFGATQSMDYEMHENPEKFERAKDLFTEFAERYEDGYNSPEEIEHIWNSLGAPTTGWASLEFYAKLNPDYMYDEVVQDFEVIKVEPKPPVLFKESENAALYTTSGLSEQFIRDFRDLVRVLNAAKVTDRRYLIRRSTEDSMWILDEKNEMRDAIRNYCVAQRENIFRAIPDQERAASTFQKVCGHKFQEDFLKQLTSYARINVLPKECNTDPDVLNTPAGLISLKTGRSVAARDSATYHTKATSVAPDPRCPIPLFQEFLEFVTNRDRAMQDYLQKFIGYSATGRTNEQLFLMAYGDGSTGKGMFVRIMEAIFHSYLTTIPSNTFLMRRGEPHPTELTEFQGYRLAVVQEFPDDAVWNEAILKTLTGSDTIKARRMHQDFYHYAPTHTVFMVSNRKPSIRTLDFAMKRRIRLIPFKVKAPPELIAKDIEKQIKTQELPGILAWVIDGAMRWYKEGLGTPPKAVLDETEAYFEAADDLAIWLNDNTIADPEGFAPISAMHKRWVGYQKEAGVAATDSIRIFGDKLESRGFPRKHTKKARGHIGLRLRDPTSEDSVLCPHCLGIGHIPIDKGDKI